MPPKLTPSLQQQRVLTAGPTIGGAVLEKLHVDAVDGEQSQRIASGALLSLGKVLGPLGSIVDAHVDSGRECLVPHGIAGLLGQEGGEGVLLHRSVGIERVVLGQQAVGDALGGYVGSLVLGHGSLAGCDHVIFEESGCRAALVRIARGRIVAIDVAASRLSNGSGNEAGEGEESEELVHFEDHLGGLIRSLEELVDH